jgi:hypothetical protein
MFVTNQNNMGKFVKIVLTKSKVADPKLEDLKFEIIGILANVKFMADKWENYLNNVFIEFLHNNISETIVDDDIILETI